MSDTHRNVPQNMEEFMKTIQGTQYEELFRDEDKVDEAFLDLLKKSDDPVAREIGSGLAEGNLTWRQIANGSVYAEFMQQSFATLNDLDVTAVFDEVAEEKGAKLDEDIENPPEDDHGDDDVWRGFSAR